VLATIYIVGIVAVFLLAGDARQNLCRSDSEQAAR